MKIETPEDLKIYEFRRRSLIKFTVILEELSEFIENGHLESLSNKQQDSSKGFAQILHERVNTELKQYES